MNKKGVWNDRMIREWGAKYVYPFDPALVESGSLDLRLSDMIRLPNQWWVNHWAELRYSLNGKSDNKAIRVVESNLQEHPIWQEPQEFVKHILWPGEFVLLSSLEVMELLPYMTGLLVLKSTPGRLGLNHSHSGHGDPGFGYGRPSAWTFEIKNIGHAPYILEAGKSIIQLRIDTMAEEPLLSYADKPVSYNGQIVPTVARTIK